MHGVEWIPPFSFRYYFGIARGCLVKPICMHGQGRVCSKLCVWYAMFPRYYTIAVSTNTYNQVILNDLVHMYNTPDCCSGYLYTGYYPT